MSVKGFDVEVFEANAYPGGKLSEFNLNGYRFDAGPSLFTMPQYVDELFEIAGKTPSNHFKYQKLDEVCRYFWDDGTQLVASSDVNLFAAEIEQNTKSTQQEIKDFLAKSEKIYNITHQVFLEKSLHKISTFLNTQTFKSFLRIFEIDAFRTMSKANESFFSDEKMIQYANRFATYNGSNPYQAPATLNVIPHLEQHFGAYFPEKGMVDITNSLVGLAKELGVKFHFNALVDEILVKNKKVIGVKVNHQIHRCEHVISNMDVYFTYKKLLKDEAQPQKF
jgi:phytoene desaturase